MSFLGQLRYHFQLVMSVCHTASDGGTMKFYNHKKSHPMIKCIRTGEVRSEHEAWNERYENETGCEVACITNYS